MSGYLRYRADRWRPVHYRATWTDANPAPEWWAALDLAWMLDVGEMSSVRENAARWGWRRTRTAALMAECVNEQVEWEQRPDRKAAAQARADKSRTRAAKLAKQRADSKAKDSGTLGDSERTNGGQFPDNPRTLSGRLARADFNPQLHPQLQPQPQEPDTTSPPADHPLPGPPSATAESCASPNDVPAPREGGPVPTREAPDRVVNAGAGIPLPPADPLPAERADTHADAPSAGGPSLDAIPRWVPPARQCGGHPRAAVLAMVVAVVEAVHGKLPNPERCGTAARPVLALWRAVGMPDPIAHQSDVCLVARWAQTSTDPLAARDIRAEGWECGTDRSRDVTTVCVQGRWDVRLAAAQAWHEQGEPAPVPGEPRKSQAQLEREKREAEEDARLAAESDERFARQEARRKGLPYPSPALRVLG